MAEIEAVAVERIVGSQITDDGTCLLIKIALGTGQETVLAFPRDQLMPLVQMAALGRVQSDKILRVSPDDKEALEVRWWELGQVPQTDQGYLSLTIDPGGRLDFILGKVMVKAIHETLQAHLGPSTAPEQKNPMN